MDLISLFYYLSIFSIALQLVHSEMPIRRRPIIQVPIKLACNAVATTGFHIKEKNTQLQEPLSESRASITMLPLVCIIIYPGEISNIFR